MELSAADIALRDQAMRWAKANRKAIAAELCEPHPSEEKPVSVFMAGSPGAGKTEASIALIKKFGGHVVRIDPDELRARLPGYDGKNAALFQGAVSTLVSRVLDVAFNQEQSFVLDGTLTNLERSDENIQRALKKQRFVQILYVYQDPLQAWEFVQAREEADKRHVPVDEFISQYFRARTVVHELKQRRGSSIQIDLLVKNIDGADRVYHDNIDRIDGYVPEKYDPERLRRLLD